MTRWYVFQYSSVNGVTDLNSYSRKADAETLVRRLEAHAREMGYDGYRYEILPGTVLNRTFRAHFELIERARNRDLGAL